MTTLTNWQIAVSSLNVTEGPIAKKLASDITAAANRWVGFGSPDESILSESSEHGAWRSKAVAQITQLRELAASIDGAAVGSAGTDLASEFVAAKTRLKAAKTNAPNDTVTDLIALALAEPLPVEPRYYNDAYYITRPRQGGLTPPRSALALREALDRADAFLAL